MEAFRRLPDEIVPYAERMFAWFPEVLVTLGNAKLGEVYELPPKASVQMRLEETADCKLVQIRLHRRPRRPPPQPSPSSGTEDESPFTKSRAFAADAGYEEEECESPFSKARALAAAERTLVAEPASTPGSGGNRRSSRNSGSPGGPTRPTTGEQDAAHEPVQAEATREAAQAEALDQASCNAESTHVSAGAHGSAAPALDSSLGSTAPAHGAGAGARQEEEEEEQEGGRQEAGGDGDQRADPRLEGGPESDEASEPTVPRRPLQESSAQHAEAAAPEAASSEGKRTASPRTTP